MLYASDKAPASETADAVGKFAVVYDFQPNEFCELLDDAVGKYGDLISANVSIFSCLDGSYPNGQHEYDFFQPFFSRGHASVSLSVETVIGKVYAFMFLLHL